MNTESLESTQELQRRIAEHPFLYGMRPEHLHLMAEAAMPREFETGEVIFREGDIANRFYLIMEGKVALEARQEFRDPVLIQEIGSGDVLGWSWLFAPYYWHFGARATASEPTRAVFFYGTRLREQCEADPSFGYELMKRMTRVVIDRLQATRQCLLKSSATERICAGSGKCI